MLLEPLVQAADTTGYTAAGRMRPETMERVWAIQQVKDAIEAELSNTKETSHNKENVWEEVEDQLQIGKSRRQQLWRLTRFTPEQQRTIALLRLPETNLRPLHTALNNKELSEEQVDQILKRLLEIAAERTKEQAQEQGENGTSKAITIQRSTIDGPTIARLAAGTLRTEKNKQKQPAPRWLPLLRTKLERASEAIQRTQKRVSTLDKRATEEVLHEIEKLADHLASTAQALQTHRERQASEDDS